MEMPGKMLELHAVKETLYCQYDMEAWKVGLLTLAG
jgi:hypothetical protein